MSKTAYSDWQRAGGHSRRLTQHAIKMVQRNLTPGGDKNGADINLALDALEMAFTHPHINAFVIVGGDSDFISLVEKLKQYDKKVFIVGGRQFTSAILQRNCHEFIAYENLIGATGHVGANGGGSRQQSGGRHVRVERTPIEQAIPLVHRALAVLTEREVSPQLGLLKSTLLQLDSTFSERSYGAGIVPRLRREAGEGRRADACIRARADGSWRRSTARRRRPRPWRKMAKPQPRPRRGDARQPVPHARAGWSRAEWPCAGRGPRHAADGLVEFRALLGTAEIRRWPMYLRNVKQMFRQATPVFDERAYGYGTLVDLLRAAQKEGIVRLERDRQGVVRVFQGAGTPQRPVAVPDVTPEPEVTASGRARSRGRRSGRRGSLGRPRQRRAAGDVRRARPAACENAHATRRAGAARRPRKKAD